jgi:tetratricopeptide (TPR) repeat protein
VGADTLAGRLAGRLDRLTSLGAVGVTLLLAVVVYLPSLGNGHALDDLGDIVENSAVHGVGNAAEILTSPYRGRVPPGRSPFRPITSLSYALSWSMGSGAPLPFHGFNVALHAANTGLVTALLSVLGAAPALALVGGALFAVHPVHSEAVANGVGRGDALMTLFVLLGVLAYLRPWRSGWIRAVLVAAAYAMALGAKENGVVLPALLVAVTLLAPSGARVGETDGPTGGPGDRSLLSDWPVFACLAAVLVGYLALRYQVLGTLFHRDAAPYIIILPASVRMATALANVTELARLLLFPADLAADYGPDVIIPATISSIRFWGGLGVTFGLVTLGVMGFRRGRWITLGVAWTVLAIAVVGNLVFPVGVWIAERTLYLPSVGVSFLAIGAWQRLGVGAPERIRTALMGSAALLVLLGGARTWTRNAAWADTDAVLLTLAEEHPESYRAQWWMGQTLIDNGQFDRGIDWLRQAGELNPNELRVQLDYVRGLLLAGRSEEALSFVSELPPFDPSRDVYLTQSHIQLGQLDQAQAAVQQGLERFPNETRLINQARDLSVSLGGAP